MSSVQMVGPRRPGAPDIAKSARESLCTATADRDVAKRSKGKKTPVESAAILVWLGGYPQSRSFVAAREPSYLPAQLRAPSRSGAWPYPEQDGFAAGARPAEAELHASAPLEPAKNPRKPAAEDVRCRPSPGSELCLLAALSVSHGQ